MEVTSNESSIPFHYLVGKSSAYVFPDSYWQFYIPILSTFKKDRKLFWKRTKHWLLKLKQMNMSQET